MNREAHRARHSVLALRAEHREWMDALCMGTVRPPQTLDFTPLGPHWVMKLVSPHEFKLDLRACMPRNGVHNVPLLNPVTGDLLPGQKAVSPPAAEDEGNQ